MPIKITKREVKGNPRIGNFNYKVEGNDLGRFLSAMFVMGKPENMSGVESDTESKSIFMANKLRKRGL